MTKLFRIILTVFFLSLISQTNSNAEKLDFSVGVWDGEVKKGKAHGEGTFYFSNGAVYEGKMKRNKFHGKGKLTTNNNKIYEGKFKRGNFYLKDKKNKKLRKVIELRLEGRFFYERHEIKGTGSMSSKWYPAEKKGDEFRLSKKGLQMMNADINKAKSDSSSGGSSGGAAC